jgi:hypothetical protein
MELKEYWSIRLSRRATGIHYMELKVSVAGSNSLTRATLSVNPLHGVESDYKFTRHLEKPKPNESITWS